MLLNFYSCFGIFLKMDFTLICCYCFEIAVLRWGQLEMRKYPLLSLIPLYIISFMIIVYV
jgi:hypothetical protein